MGWGDLVTGELDIVELPVNPHAMLVEPYVKILASQLKEKMEKADRCENESLIPIGSKCLDWSMASFPNRFKFALDSAA